MGIAVMRTAKGDSGDTAVINTDNGGNVSVTYRKYNKQVWLNVDVVSCPTGATVVVTLPEAYRPTIQLSNTVTNGTSTMSMVVGTDGTVTITGTAAAAYKDQMSWFGK